MADNQELLSILGMTDGEETLAANSRTNNNQPFNDLDLIQDREVETEDEVEHQPEKTTTSFAQNGINRLLLVSTATGMAIFGCILFFGSAFSIGENAPLAEKIEEAEDNIGQIKLEKPENERLQAEIALFQQKEALERLKNQQDTPPPKISLETVPRPEPQVKPEPIPQPPRPTVPQRITPPARVRNRLPQPTVSKPRITRNTKPATPEYDSLEDWSALASLGSYGYTASPKASHGKTSAIDIARRTRKKNTPQVQSVSYTQSIPPLLAANYSSSQEIEQANSKFTQLLKTAENPQPVEVAKASNAIAIAQRVKAKLVNPFQAAAGVKEVHQRLFITLEEGLSDTQGLERVAPGTQLVYEIDNIDRGGIVSGTIVSLIKDNLEIPLPQDALLVSGKKGSILTANYKSRKNGGGNRDVVNFGLGATKAVGDLLNRPNSSFTSIGSFGQTQSVDYGDPNYLGSVASTGAEKVLENRVRDVERQYQDAPVIGIWELNPNTDLTITVNRAFEVQ